MCRNAYYDEHYFHKVTAFKVCPSCGEEFATTKPLAQTYCSAKCRTAAQEKKAYGEPLEFAKEAEKSVREFLEANPDHQRGQFALSSEEEGKAAQRARSYVPSKENKSVKLKADHKRPYPEDGLCELCHKSSPYRKRRLGFHHFSDEDPSAGLYLCRFCHCFAERVDQGELEHYLELKKEELSRVKL